MTPQERKLIEDLAARIGQTQVGQKDAEADTLIRQNIGSKPDALYILVQTVLVQTMALEQAQSQIADLQQKLASAPANPPSGSTSFLGSLFGSHPSSPPPPAPPQAAWQTAPPPYAGGGASSFLRSAATTAAGVAAGALAFEGIESLIHGFGHQGSMGNMGSSFLGQPAGETIVNNYYDEAPDRVDRVDDADADADTGVDTIDDADYQDDSDTADYSDDSSDDSLV